MLQDTLRVSMSIAIAQTLFRAKRVLVSSRLCGHNSPYAR